MHRLQAARPAPHRRWLSSLIALSVIFTVCAALMFGMLLWRIQEVSSSVREDALWSAYQMDRELLKFQVALSELATDGSKERVRQAAERYDIIYSRLSLLEGATFPKAFGGASAFATLTKEMAQAIRSLEPLIDRMVAESAIDPVLLHGMVEKARALQALSNDMTVSAQANATFLRVDDRESTLHLYGILGALMAALTFSMAGVVNQLFRQLRELARSSADLTNLSAELAESVAAAEAGSRAKSQFLATMSHEIRTPMNGVIGTTELLLATALTEEQRRHVATIGMCSEALLEIINDILDFSKLEAGKLELERSVFNLAALAESALDIMAPRAQEHGLQLALAIEQLEHSAFEGDSGRIRQVLLNLVSNGVKFTRHGGVAIRIRPGATAGNLRFEVRDTGIGIEQEAKDRLFVEFSQLDASVARRYGGTGLGLAICQRLVSLMGGTIGVESEPGHGSTFWFELPLRPLSRLERPAASPRRVVVVEPDALLGETISSAARSLGLEAEWMSAPPLLPQEEDIHVLPSPLFAQLLQHHRLPSHVVAIGPRPWPGIAAVEGAITPSRLAQALAEAEGTAPLAGEALQPLAAPAPQPSLNVLVVEDNAVNQQVARGLLAALGHQVTIAPDGAAGLAAVLRTRFDLVLMDVQMPGMDGLEATRAIRQLQGEARDIPIIAMTANAMASDRDDCMAAGMDGFVSKPVNNARLRSILDDLIAGRLGRQVQRAAPLPAEQPAVQGAGAAAILQFDAQRTDIDHEQRALLREALGEDSLEELTQQFWRDAEGLMAEIAEAAERQDAEAARRALHTLKGSALSVGFTAVADAAISIRARADQADWATTAVGALANIRRFRDSLTACDAQDIAPAA